MFARPFIDSLDFARNGNEIRGKAPLSELGRLSDVLRDRQGALSYILRGSVNKSGQSVLHLSAQADFELTCQRCLEKMSLLVELSSNLMLCDQATLDANEDEGDEVDCILAEANLDVVALLEDEILLALPLAPRHDSGECGARQNKELLEAGRNPFAALAGLKVVK